MWPKVPECTVSDAAQLLRLGRLVATCHAKLAKPNQNFTLGVSISAPGLMCQREALLILRPAVQKPKAEVWYLRGLWSSVRGGLWDAM